MTTKYHYNQATVDAVKVTKENREDILKKVRDEEKELPKEPRVGNWVIRKANGRYEVWTDHRFIERFTPADQAEVVLPPEFNSGLERAVSPMGRVFYQMYVRDDNLLYARENFMEEVYPGDTVVLDLQNNLIVSFQGKFPAEVMDLPSILEDPRVSWIIAAREDMFASIASGPIRIQPFSVDAIEFLNFLPFANRKTAEMVEAHVIDGETLRLVALTWDDLDVRIGDAMVVSNDNTVIGYYRDKTFNRMFKYIKR